MNYCRFCMNPIDDGTTTCPKCGRNLDSDIQPHHLNPGTLLNNRYWVGAAIGEGGFGITYVGRDTMLDLKVAIKEYYPSGHANRSNLSSATVSSGTKADSIDIYEKGKKKFLSEARSLARFSGEDGIVSVRDFFEENNTAYIVMEYLEGETLKVYLSEKGTLTPDETIKLMLPVMESLKKVHEAGIIHRDIAPDNIMLTKDKVKLLDFGAARSVDNFSNKSLSVMLKPGYAPEEQYRSRGQQGPWTDIYALCATMYKCITGITPDDAAQRSFEDEVKAPSDLGITISQNVESAILKGMSVYQRDRYQTVDELISALTGKDKSTAVVAGVVAGAGVATGTSINVAAASDNAKSDPKTFLMDDDPHTIDMNDDPKTVEMRDKSEQKSEGKKKKKFIIPIIIGIVAVGGIAAAILAFLNKKPYNSSTIPNTSTDKIISDITNNPQKPTDYIPLSTNTAIPATTSIIVTGTEVPNTPTERAPITPTKEVTSTPTSQPTATSTKQPTSTPTDKPTATATSVPTPVKSMVSLDANGGSVSTSSKEVTYNSTYGTLPNPAREGYKFDGWYTAANNGSKVTESTKVTATSNHTIYAHWTANNYTVSFNGNEGSVSTSSKSVTYGSPYGLLPTPTRSGYSFGGWFTAASGGTQVTDSSNVTTASNHTLYAHWNSGNKYTVELNPNGGVLSNNSITVTYNSTYGSLNTPTRSGYSFEGWYTSANGGSKVTSSTKVTTASNHTIYAHWSANSYTVSFNANGGSVSNSSMSVTFDSTYGDLPTPTRTGYRFEGWYTAASGGSKVTSSDKVSTASNHTLYAHWSGPSSYTVSFNANGGSVSTSSKSVTFDSTYGDLPTPTRTGYGFEGWYTAASSGSKVASSTKVTTASNHTLYAHWSGPSSYTVSFNANGGSVSTSSKSVTFDSTYGDLPTPTRTGYGFDGWYTAASGGTKVTSNTKVSTASNHTLYAHWSGPSSYTVSFNANGGSVSPSSTNVTYDSTYGDLPTPTRTGYTFDGWYTSASGGTKVNSSTKVTTASNHTLYAHWSANTYSVKFNANGGSGSMSNQSFTYGVAQNLRSNTFTKTNCVFLGWSTNSSATSATYTNGQNVSNLTATAGQAVNLYAIWESVTISATSATLSRVPTGISLNKTSLTLATETTNDYGKTGSITASASGYDSPTKTITATASNGAAITWSSSNTSIATVSSSGVITAKGAGTATITAATSNGAKATCSVTVSNTNTAVTWSTNKSSVATVSSGTVTAVSKGSATITATMNGYSKTCTVTVGKTYKAIALTSSSAYADFNCNNQGGLFSVYSSAGTSFKLTFITGSTVPSEGCLYQCYNDTSKYGFMITFSSGKINVTCTYNGNDRTQTSGYTLSPNTVYTVEVSFNKGTTTPFKGSIVIKNEAGTTLDTKSCEWAGNGYGKNSSASIGPNSSIKNGKAPNIYLMSINFTGSTWVDGSTSLHSCSMNFSAGSIGTQTFTNNGCTARFTGTQLGYHVVF